MKPPLFEYIRPATVEEAVAARAAHEDSVVLAGGQSLIPTLNFRIANPDAVIDIARIQGLDRIAVEGGSIRVGAMARHRDVELSDEVHAANPLLRDVLGNVAHIVVRNRGTVVGSIAHADAAAEMPCVLLALDGHVVAQGPNGRREIAAADFFQFHMTTALAADELLVEAVFPALPAGAGWAFREFARRHGDYALAGICAVLELDGDTCRTARLAACGIASTPVRLSAVEDRLAGARLDKGSVAAAAAEAGQYVTAEDEPQATAAYRRHLTAALVRATVAEAAGRAGVDVG